MGDDRRTFGIPVAAVVPLIVLAVVHGSVDLPARRSHSSGDAVGSRVSAARSAQSIPCSPSEFTWRPIGRLRVNRFAAGGAVIPRGAVDPGQSGLYFYGGLSPQADRDTAESTLMRLALDDPPDPNVLAVSVDDVAGQIPQRWGMGSMFVPSTNRRFPALVFIGGSDTDVEPPPTPTTVPPTRTPPPTLPPLVAPSGLAAPLDGGEAAVDAFVAIEFAPGQPPRRPPMAAGISPILDHALASASDGDDVLVLWHGGHQRVGDRPGYSAGLIRRAIVDAGASMTLLSDVTGPPARFGHTMVAMDPPPGGPPATPGTPHRFVLYGGTVDGSVPVQRADALWAIEAPSNIILAPTFSPVSVNASDPPPSARFFHAAGWDPVRQWMVIYGGNVAPVSGSQTPDQVDETWALDFSVNPPRWRRLPRATLGGSGYARSTVAWDPDGDRLLLFGGRRGNLTNPFVYELACDVVAGLPTPTPSATASPMATPSPTTASPTALVVDTPDSGPTTPAPIITPSPSATAPHTSTATPRTYKVHLPKVSRMPACEEDSRSYDLEPNDLIDQLKGVSLLPASAVACGWFPLDLSDDRDYYKMEVSPNQIIKAVLYRIPNGVRWDLHLFSAKRELVGCTDPWSETADDIISPLKCGLNSPVDPLRDAKYLSAVSGAGGIYYLTVRNRTGRSDHPYALRWWSEEDRVTARRHNGAP